MVEDENGNKRYTVISCPANVTTILRYHPSWRGLIAFDDFIGATVTVRRPPWDAVDMPQQCKAGPWTDSDTGRLVNWLERHEGIRVPTSVVEQTIQIVSEATRFHPVREYLKKLVWDKKPRLDTFIYKYLGGDNTRYTKAVGAKWMISAVARVMEPGVQADCVLILESIEQGWRKTSSMRALVPVREWYADTGIIIGDKDSYQNIRGVWIYGLDELDSLKRGELTRTKNYITSTSDRYRPSYARRSVDVPRQNVFVGTTNETEYFTDRTGNRRFWPVTLRKRANADAIRADRDQLWAEAYVRYRKGERHYVDTEELRRLCEGEQASRMQADPWEMIIAKWLVDPCERDFFGDVGTRRVDNSAGVLLSDVLTHALGRKHSQIEHRDSVRAAGILRTLGYERGPLRRESDILIRRYVKKPPRFQVIQGDGGKSPTDPKKPEK